MKKGFLDVNDFIGSGKRKYREIPIKDREGHNLRLGNEGEVTPRGKAKKQNQHYTVGRLVWGQQSDNPERVMIIEELVWETGKKELRFAYRTLTPKTGKWHWGQYALMTPQQDIEELLTLAVEKGLLH